MQHRLTTATGSLAFTEVGAGATTFVFLHFWGGSSRTWGSVVERLQAQARCVALDLRGWGASSALDGRYDLDAMAGDVLALLSSLRSGPVVLVGHSMGGKVALMAATTKPEGLSGLVLVAPAPPGPMPVPPEGRSAMLASYQSRDGARGALDVLGGRDLPDGLREQVVADILAGHPDAKRAWTDGGMTQDITAMISGLQLPVEIVVGDRDEVEPPVRLAAAYAPVLAQMRMTVLEGVGHLCPLQAPDAVARACSAML
jgi:3-oxoadipate enol-lactonase